MIVPMSNACLPPTAAGRMLAPPQDSRCRKAAVYERVLLPVGSLRKTWS